MEPFEIEIELHLGFLLAFEPGRVRRPMQHVVGRTDLSGRQVEVVRQLEDEVDFALVDGAQDWRVRLRRRAGGRTGRRGRPQRAAGAAEDLRRLEQIRIEVQDLVGIAAAARHIRDLERRAGGRQGLASGSPRRAMQTGDPGDLLGLRIALDGERQEARRGADVSGILEAEHRVGDEGDVSGLGLDRLGVDLRRLLDLVVAQHQVGDQPVLRQRLLGQLLAVEELGELDVRRRIVGDQDRHLLQHADRRSWIAVLLVVVDQHLILRPRLRDQALFVVQLRQPFVDREPRRIELDDLLVDRDRLDEESVVRVAVGDLREEPHGLVDAIDARVQVAQPVQRRGVVRVLGEKLAVLLDRGFDLAARNELLR